MSLDITNTQITYIKKNNITNNKELETISNSFKKIYNDFNKRNLITIEDLGKTEIKACMTNAKQRLRK